MIINADFHLHSCLSPCGDLAMSPSAIAECLAAKNIRLAALTDHNSALNCPAFADVCAEYGIAALYGMEAQTMEETHMLCLFAHLDTALAFGAEIYALMPPVRNNPEKTGDQIYVDRNETILGEVEKYLIVSANIGLDDLAERVHRLGGLAIPAHVDRAAFSLTSQLGLVPEGCWDALEVVRLPQGADAASLRASNPALNETAFKYPLITSSDAHYIEHVGRRAFTLDIDNLPLIAEDGTVNIETVKKALEKRRF